MEPLLGLNYSLPQLHALRNQVLLLGIGQVALTTGGLHGNWRPS
jgi:hypothetical protein